MPLPGGLRVPILIEPFEKTLKVSIDSPAPGVPAGPARKDVCHLYKPLGSDLVETLDSPDYAILN